MCLCVDFLKFQGREVSFLQRFETECHFPKRGFCNLAKKIYKIHGSLYKS